MKLRLLTVAVLAAMAIAALAAVTASAATVRHVEGRVSAVDRDARSFTLRDSERGTFRVFVGSSTRFERTSFARLRTGSRVEATIRRSDGRWVASHVETSGGGGRHGGENEAGDDRGGHGADG
jgi:opacity protein-like surface antigen